MSLNFEEPSDDSKTSSIMFGDIDKSKYEGKLFKFKNGIGKSDLFYQNDQWQLLSDEILFDDEKIGYCNTLVQIDSGNHSIQLHPHQFILIRSSILTNEPSFKYEYVGKNR